MDNQARIPILNRNGTNGGNQVRKRLFVFCDGTWQDGINKNIRLTNVATLARCLEGVSDDNYLQIVHYDNGIGNATNLPSRIIDGATGRGMSVKIRNAYSFLSHNYDFSHEYDEIFLIGFSRGAFAVQCLASFISQTGLFRKEHLYYLRGLFTLWKHQDFKRMGNKGRSAISEQLDRYIEIFRGLGLLPKVEIKACVVWDTVSALGFPTPWPRPLSFVGKRVPKAVENAFQVLALDEKRTGFQPCIWESKEKRETCVKQCWFLGSHADVGGNGDAVLGAVAFAWIIGQLRANTNAKFNEAEIMRHFKHRFLEWDFCTNEFLGQIKENAILSNLPTVGKISKPPWYWWLPGLKSRDNYLQPNKDCPDLQLIHFTARFSMAEGRNKSKLLRKWTTEIHGGGKIAWRLQDKVLLENSLDSGNHKEYDLFKSWSKMRTNLIVSDRTRFAAEAPVIIEDKSMDSKEMERNLESFISLLKKNLRFTDYYLAPDLMYSPNEPFLN